MLDKSIANSVAKIDGLKARFALSRATTFDQSGQDLTGTPQLQRSLSRIQWSKKAISLSARISGWAPRIMLSKVEPLCPHPTTKTNRRKNLLPVDEDFSIGQLEGFIGNHNRRHRLTARCELVAIQRRFELGRLLPLGRRLRVKKRCPADWESHQVRRIASRLVIIAGQIVALVRRGQRRSVGSACLTDQRSEATVTCTWVWCFRCTLSRAYG